jgi:hypothetical protein
MIPKNQIKGPFLSLAQAEEVIDLAISECNDSTPIYVKLAVHHSKTFRVRTNCHQIARSEIVHP